ncbi:hypothetical protein EJV46_14875 [Roseococcus sp. SYP-B2431]|uniref:hypothetical protein n=1 Tax=Roseococcus sp. SYP-B2431 TaxID=2496640 RepID=UPI0010D84D51|nr:hypothetical protein [Roseococcus sp. SYP-B2431]TCH97416.1 hypothetical protein EJV46_14875 [Roseococcus sp. SYP-B2431]
MLENKKLELLSEPIRTEKALRAMAAGGVPLYRNSRSWRLRCLCLGFWALVAFFAAGALLIHATGSDRGNDVESFAGLALVIGAFALLLDTYRRVYVISMRRLGDELHVETLGLFSPGRHRLDGRALRGARQSRYLARGRVSTATLLPRPGRWFPFVIDTTEDRLHAPIRRP